MTTNTETWTDEQDIIHGFCCICGVEVSTHDDAGQLAFSRCGDCGRPTCGDHRADDGAARCFECQAAAHQAADPHCSCNDCLADSEIRREESYATTFDQQLAAGVIDQAGFAIEDAPPTHLNLALVPDLHVQVDYYGHPKIGRVTGITKRTVTVEIHVGKGRRHYVREFTKNIRDGYVFAPFSLNSDRDILTRGITSFESFDALVNAKGGYRPTLLGAGLFDILANTYDRYQRVRGDDRRAYRRNVEW